MTSPNSIFRNLSSMEPLLPKGEAGMPGELSVEIIRTSGELEASLPSPVVRGEVAKLVREMNSYYSNLIEGHKTLPRDIEAYLRFTRVDLDGKLRAHLERLLKALCLEGEIARGAIPGILGLKGTATREVIRKALDEELVSTPSPKGRLKIAFPNKVVDSYFPQLFTDLPVDVE